MKKVLEFLTENPPFYIATVDGNKPKVRPFGFVMEFEGKLYLCTNNQKNVYKQLQENPYFEICAATPDGKWIRLNGKAVFHTTPVTKAMALETMPSLEKMYSVDDSIFELFYIEDGEATFYSMKDSPKTFKI